MDLEQILAILARIGTDNPPASSELQAAQTELSRLLLAEAQGNRDLSVMAPIRQAYDQAGAELQVALAREAADQARIDDMIAGIADPDAAETPDPETPPEPAPGDPGGPDPTPLPAPDGPPESAGKRFGAP